MEAAILAFFTALFGMVGWLIKGRYDEKRGIDSVAERVDIAVESADRASRNTENVSNGFAGRVLGLLEKLNDKVDAIGTAQREHLEWHLEREKG